MGFSVVVLLALLALGVLGIVRVRRRRAARRAGAAPPGVGAGVVAAEEGVPTFRVVALGRHEHGRPLRLIYGLPSQMCPQ